jgi:hypothetical protein
MVKAAARVLVCRGLLGLGMAFALLAPAWAAGGSGLQFGPPPGWVQSVEVPLDTPAPAGGAQDGQQYLLADVQTRVDGGRVSEYRQMAVRALNQAGVESLATLSISFDPRVERLQLHSVALLRQGQRLDRRDPKAWQLMRREARLQELVLDGRMTAAAVLPDVRVGDVLLYAYTVQRENPVFGGRLAGGFDQQWSLPAARSLQRLLWPNGRTLQLRAHNDAAAPQLRELGSHVEYRWQRDAVPALTVDRESPEWFDPFPWSQWSEYPSWQSVAQWAEPLYASPLPLPAALQRELELISREQSDPEARLLAALRFVQREIRYLSMPMGVSSHAPSAPELVLRRRFGDCKDKTRLLLALLRGLGIQAEAALVNTQRGKGIADWLPTPYAFDHVLVRAELDGKSYWLDPTAAPQPGKRLSQVLQAEHGLALRVRADSQQLVPMAGLDSQRQQRELQVRIDASEGLDAAARMEIHTRLRGASAARMRATLARSSLSELQRQYVDFYAQYYPGTVADGELRSEEDAETGELKLTERYSLPKFWARNEQQGRHEGTIAVPDLLDGLREPPAGERRHPLRLQHPLDLRVSTEVLLPIDWKVEPTPVKVEHAAFRLERQEIWKSPRHLQLIDRYQTRVVEVSASDVPALRGQLEKARGDLSYQLYRYDRAISGAGNGGLHPVPLLLSLLVLLGLGVGAWKLWTWDPAPAAPRPEGPSGVGGWLLLPAFGMLMSIWLTLSNLIAGAAVYEAMTWTALTDPSSQLYHRGWLPALLASLSLGLALVAANTLSLVLLAMRRSSFAKVFIGTMLLAMLATGVELMASYLVPPLAESSDGKELPGFIRSLAAGIIWIAYMLRSARVANTFTRRRRAQEAGAVLAHRGA